MNFIDHDNSQITNSQITLGIPHRQKLGTARHLSVLISKSSFPLRDIGPGIERLCCDPGTGPELMIASLNCLIPKIIPFILLPALPIRIHFCI